MINYISFALSCLICPFLRPFCGPCLFLYEIERVVEFQNRVFLWFDMQLFGQDQTKVFKLAVELYFHAIGPGKGFRITVRN